MPGNPLGIGAPTQTTCALFYLDLKNANKYDKNDLNYVKTLSMEKWTTLLVQDPTFCKMPPTAAVSINAVEMIIFGGSNQKCYTFNVQEVATDVSGGGKIAKLKQVRNSQLREIADFCTKGDFFGRVFQN